MAIHKMRDVLRDAAIKKHADHARAYSDDVPKVTIDYSTLENGCLYNPRSNTIGHVWMYVPEDDTFYCQWPDTHLEVSRSGKSAWWYAYDTSGKTRPILLQPFEQEGKGNWLINPGSVPKE